MPTTSRVGRIVTAALALLAAQALARLATPVLAVDYWVKNGGDDGASGTSVAQAGRRCRTPRTVSARATQSTCSTAATRGST